MVTIVALEMGLVRHVYPAGWGRVDSAYTASLSLLTLISGMCNVVVYAERRGPLVILGFGLAFRSL